MIRPAEIDGRRRRRSPRSRRGTAPRGCPVTARRRSGRAPRGRRDRSPGCGRWPKRRTDLMTDSPHHEARRGQVRTSPDSGPDVRRPGRVRQRRLATCAWSPRTRPRPSSDRATACTSTARPRPRRSCSTAWSRARPSSATSRSSTSTCEGPGPHLAPEMAGHFRHRALFIGPNARAAVNEGRADYVPVFLSDVPRLFESGALPLDVVFVNATPPDAHGFCSLGTSVEAMHAAIRAAKTVVVQLNRAHAADARRELHPCQRHRPRGRGRRPALRPREPGHRRRRAADRRARRGARAGPRDAPARDRGDPDGDRARPDRQARPGDPHRDVHRRGRRPRRGGRRHRRRQGAQPGQDRHDVPDGLAAALRVRPRQPDGRDAGRRLHERHPRHPLVQPDGRRSTPRSRST